jgi:hypothetical protein
MVKRMRMEMIVGNCIHIKQVEHEKFNLEVTKKCPIRTVMQCSPDQLAEAIEIDWRFARCTGLKNITEEGWDAFLDLLSSYEKDVYTRDYYHLLSSIQQRRGWRRMVCFMDTYSLYEPCEDNIIFRPLNDQWVGVWGGYCVLATWKRNPLPYVLSWMLRMFLLGV